MVWLVNLLLPGVGLVWRGRLVVGLLAVALVALVLVTAAVGWALTVAGEPARLLVWQAAASGWLIAVVWAATWWWLCERDGPDDPAVYNDCARSAQAALLRGEGDRAVEHAQRVVRGAPRRATAWELLARCAQASGNERLAGRAQKRARWLAKQEHLERGERSSA
jgi:hypothetical protein